MNNCHLVALLFVAGCGGANPTVEDMPMPPLPDLARPTRDLAGPPPHDLSVPDLSMTFDDLTMASMPDLTMAPPPDQTAVTHDLAMAPPPDQSMATLDLVMTTQDLTMAVRDLAPAGGDLMQLPDGFLTACFNNGMCPFCTTALGCSKNSDCSTTICGPAPNPVCLSEGQACCDGVKDGEETGPDCGGPVCMPCMAGQGCLIDNDCQGYSLCGMPGCCCIGGQCQC
jgi:hypothetical protein